MIAEAAYYLAQKRGFSGEHTLDDWLAAERQVRVLIAPPTDEASMNEASMNQTTDHDQPNPKPKSPSARVDTTAAVHTAVVDAAAVDAAAVDAAASTAESTRKRGGASRYATFAATQAAGDGIQGDVRKSGKTPDEKIGANMADRK